MTELPNSQCVSDSENLDVFLLTSVDRSGSGIGTIFLNDILKTVPSLRVEWRVIAPFLTGSISSKTGALGKVLRALLARLGVVNSLRLYIYYFWFKNKQLDEIEEEFRSSKASMFWVTASSPELIFLAAGLAERGVNVRVTVWDDPSYFIENLCLSKRCASKVFESFWMLLRLADSCSVVSEGMKAEYSKQVSNSPIVVMRHGVSSLRQETKKELRKTVRIIFAGSLYSKDEWNAFCRALDSIQWKISKKDIQLEFVGDFPLRGAFKPRNLIVHPRMEPQDVMDFMTRADIGYLPYWLQLSKEYVARTSFPGKLTAYSAAGLAIFHHGPKTSSVTEFLNRYPYGVACCSLDHQDILLKLSELLCEMNTPKSQKAWDAAMNNELSQEAMSRGFHAFLGKLPPTSGDDV